MATQYIVTQIWSPRHIVTRGFGAFIDTDFGQAEIIELGEVLVNRVVDMNAYICHEKDFVAYVLTEHQVLVER